MDIFCI